MENKIASKNFVVKNVYKANMKYELLNIHIGGCRYVYTYIGTGTHNVSIYLNFILGRQCVQIYLKINKDIVSVIFLSMKMIIKTGYLNKNVFIILLCLVGN